MLTRKEREDILFEVAKSDEKNIDNLVRRHEVRIKIQESLILAQNERWRCAYYMQVERALRETLELSGGRVSKV